MAGLAPNGGATLASGPPEGPRPTARPPEELDRRTYRAYRRRQAGELLRLLPPDALRPLYKRARAWAREDGGHDLKDPMRTLLRFCEDLLPLPPSTPGGGTGRRTPMPTSASWSGVPTATAIGTPSPSRYAPSRTTARRGTPPSGSTGPTGRGAASSPSTPDPGPRSTARPRSSGRRPRPVSAPASGRSSRRPSGPSSGRLDPRVPAPTPRPPAARALDGSPAGGSVAAAGRSPLPFSSEFSKSYFCKKLVT